MYADPEHQYRQRIINYVCKPVVDWHSKQNKQNRSTTEARQWLISQCNNGFMESVAEIIGKLADTRDMERLGFIFGAQLHTSEVIDMSCTDPQVIAQDELASLLGELVCSLAATRIRRHADMTIGWPLRACLMLSPDTALDTISDLKFDYEDFQWLTQLRSASAERISNRSAFRTMPCIQLVEMLRLSGWQNTLMLKEHIADMSSKLLGTQIVEDGFNRTKTPAKDSPNGTISNERIMQNLLEKRVLEGLHRYRRPDETAVDIPRTGRLPEQAFHPKVATAWPKLKDIYGYQQACSWYSPKPEAYQDHFADLSLVRHLRQCNREGLLGEAWQACLFRVGRIAVRDKTGAQCGGEWHLVLGPMGNDACIGWPMNLKRAGDNVYMVPQPTEGKRIIPRILVCLDHRDWEAAPVQFVSPLNFILQTGLSGHIWGVQMEVGKMEGLMGCAARLAFGDLSLTNLRALCEVASIPLDKGEDFFNTLFKLVQGVLGTSEEDTMNILVRRCAAPASCDCLAELAEVDEVVEILGPQEKQDFNQDVSVVKNLEAERKKFTRQYGEKNKTILAARAKAAPKAKAAGKGGQRGRGRGAWAPLSEAAMLAMVPPGAITQQEASSMAPPGAHIWRSLGSANWQGHLPNHRRKSRSWALYGHRESCILVLQELWRQYLAERGETEADCPVQGIFAQQ